jgi:hypothetical protein
MTTKPQTRSNAKRSAEAATRRTGIEHIIEEVEGGWAVTQRFGVPAVALAGPGDGPALDDEPQASAPQGFEDFTREVAGFLETEGCGAVITTEDEARTMIKDGHANGRPATRVAEATGWGSNTVRGFLAGLKKKGIKVETLERVRQVGTGKEGTRGSYSIYKLSA